jgi:hypothetical protein
MTASQIHPLKAVMPMKVHLKKFMGCMVKVDPLYEASRDDVFGSYMYQMLSDKYSLVQSKPAGLDEKIIVGICPKWMNHGRYVLTEKHIILFNDFVENLFYTHFYMYMDMSVSMGFRQDHSRAAFCDLMNLVIDHDINDQTLKKRYDRFSKDRTKFSNPFKLSDGKPQPKFVAEHFRNGFSR